MIFPVNIKGGKSARNFISSAIFRAGWIDSPFLSSAIIRAGWTDSPFLSSAIFRAGEGHVLFLSSSRTIHHEESTFNLWTVVPRRSILHYSFNPPRPTAPRWFKLDVKFRLWLQQFDSCSVFRNSATLFMLWHSATLLAISTITIVLFLRFSAQWFYFVSSCY